MADERQYTIEQAMQALTAMRREAGLPEQLFPVQAFVGMVSDEIEALRAGGRSDEAIARLIEENSAVRVSAEEIGRFYATPEERAGHGGEGGRG